MAIFVIKIMIIFFAEVTFSVAVAHCVIAWLFVHSKTKIKIEKLHSYIF